MWILNQIFNHLLKLSFFLFGSRRPDIRVRVGKWTTFRIKQSSSKILLDQKALVRIIGVSAKLTSVNIRRASIINPFTEHEATLPLLVILNSLLKFFFI